MEGSVADFTAGVDKLASEMEEETIIKDVENKPHTRFRDILDLEGFQEDLVKGIDNCAEDLQDAYKGTRGTKGSGTEKVMIGGRLVGFEEQMIAVVKYWESDVRKRVYPPGCVGQEQNTFRKRAKRYQYDQVTGALFRDVKGIGRSLELRKQ